MRVGLLFSPDVSVCLSHQRNVRAKKRATCNGLGRRCDAEVGAAEKLVSSLAASFFLEGVARLEDVGASAPRGVFPNLSWC